MVARDMPSVANWRFGVCWYYVGTGVVNSTWCS